MTSVRTMEVDADGQGQRLDRWFRRQFPHVPQGRIEKMCRKGEIRVDGGRVKASSRLESGQSVRIPPLPETPAAAPVQRPSGAEAQMLRDTVLFADDHIIVLNKPSGLAVQGGSGTVQHVDNLAAALVGPDEQKPKLVHRLDRDTSGLLVLAKTGRAAAQLSKAFQSKVTRKIYWALVSGVPHPPAGTIRFGLVKSAGAGRHGGEQMMAIHPDMVAATEGAKHAVTDYMTLESLAKRAAWVALVPVTGRTHQLRAHMAAIGAPIAGDGKYGRRDQTNDGDGWGAQIGGAVSGKLHLHARHLTLPHPETGRMMTFTAPLPRHMKSSWELFGWSAEDHAGDPFEETE